MDGCASETSNYLFNQDNFYSHFAYWFGMIRLRLDYLFIETWQKYNCTFMSAIKKKNCTQANSLKGWKLRANPNQPESIFNL